MLKTTTLLAAIAGLALAGCAAPLAADGGPAKPPTKRACFFASQVNGWRSGPDDKIVYLEVGTRDIYKAELFGRCNDIDSALTIGIVTRGGGSTICEGLDLDLVVGSPIGPQRCAVTRLTKLTPEEAAALPHKFKP